MTPLDPTLVDGPYPLQKHLGFTMAAWEPDYVRFELPIAEFLGNRYGIPHGGVYATLLDTVMGYSGCYTGSSANPRMAMTLSMTVNFLSRPKGKLLIGEGRRTGGGARTFYSEGVITDETGEKIATSMGTFRYRSGKSEAA